MSNYNFFLPGILSLIAGVVFTFTFYDQFMDMLSYIQGESYTLAILIGVSVFAFLIVAVFLNPINNMLSDNKQ